MHGARHVARGFGFIGPLGGLNQLRHRYAGQFAAIFETETVRTQGLLVAIGALGDELVVQPALFGHISE